MTRRLAIGLSLLAAGCGDAPPAPPSYGGPDGQAIATLISDFNEAKHDPGQLKKLFAGPLPKDARKYDRFNVDLDGAPAVSGDTATGKVKLRPEVGGGDDKSAEWTFVREGGTWKVKSAPLP